MGGPGISRIAVIGDSVAWGQGLVDSHKYANQIAALAGVSSPTDLCMCAHSGAVIGPTTATTTAVNPEVPEAIPTVLSQLSSITSPATIDLLLINGGINDVSINEILNPLTDLNDLRIATKQACYAGMKSLLATAAKICTQPTCQFAVTGYYPIISPLSDPLSVSEDALVHLLGIFNNGFPLGLAKADQNLMALALSARAIQFWQDSEKFLAQAVTESAMQLNLPGRLFFVSTGFNEANALFTDNSLLFGFGPDLAPQDEVIAQRTAACNRQYSPFDPASRVMCYHASVGHPNVAGSLALSTAIAKTLGLRK